MDKIGQAYGAGMAGAANFDPVKFIKQPQVIVRIVAWVFCIIVFGTISSSCWWEDDGEWYCMFNNSSGACGFATAIGVLGFLACLLFLAIDAYFDNISSVQLRKQVVIGDLAASGVFTFMWFVVFCYLANQWSKTETPSDWAVDGPQAVIAFSFFSFFAWAGLTFLAWRRYQQGAATAFQSSNYEQDFAQGGQAPPYGYPGGASGTESYQEPPFSAANEPAGAPQYNQPAY